ncbi:MAG: hypothetical protein J3Q66DRAFT_355872, partial [Benniella sp.]
MRFAVGLYELWRLFFAAFLLLFFFSFLVLVPCGSESPPSSVLTSHPTPSHRSRSPRPHPNPQTHNSLTFLPPTPFHRPTPHPIHLIHSLWHL